MNRQDQNKEKDCQPKKLATKRKKDKKNKKNSSCITPHTERSTPGRNWELFKNIAANSSPPEIDTSGKENVEKMLISCSQQSQEKNKSKPKLDTTQQLIGEINTSGKENVEKKSISCSQQSQNKHKFKPKLDITRQLIGEINTSGKENVEKKSISYSQQSQETHLDTTRQLIEETEERRRKKKVTKFIAMDCEMVGIGDGTQSMIARVSIVNSYYYCIYDKYVKPREPVQDYRTKVSGIRPHNLQNGEEFQIVQKEVAEILRGRILIGHALKYDLDVLYLSHPRRHLRDTSKFKIFKQLSDGRTPSLKKLAFELLGRQIQTGEHSSVEDARAAMQLYLLYKNKLESEFYSKKKKKMK